MNQITVVMPVKNEADNLRRGIPLAAKLGPVLVVDSGSTDGTQQIAHELGAELLEFNFTLLNKLMEYSCPLTPFCSP
jgi:glycosyltransferase involved in cell wall biosynthesis